MHVETDVKWLEWKGENFERARREKKAVLLDLYGDWCYWCTRMEVDCYSNKEIASIINDRFIPIKVDIDKRPDIKERYHFGGFPTTAFLDYEGKVLKGATYIPLDIFKSMLLEVSQDYNNGLRVEGLTYFQNRKMAEEFQSGVVRESRIDSGIIEEIKESIIYSFDDVYGGFGTEPKFPMSDVLEFLLELYKRTKENGLLTTVEKTLKGMEGIYDKKDGGFFRYSVSRDWSVPHYEKMLETNAALFSIYLEAYKTTKNERYKEIVEKGINYVTSRLLSNENGFYGSQDAGDEEYYKEEDRNKDKEPEVVKAIYIDWSSQMSSSFLKAYGSLDNESYKKIGIRSVGFILDECYRKDEGFCHYYNGDVFGLLNDNAYGLRAVLDAYEITNDNMYLNSAKELIGFLVKNFYDENLGGFYDRVSKDDDVGELKVRDKALDGNIVMTENLIRLFSLTKDSKYKEMTEKTLKYFLKSYHNYGISAAGYGLQVKRFLELR
jgi:uncharacterized protein